MSILKFLASDGFLTVNKHIARAVGLDAAVMLAELASSYNYFEMIGQLTDGTFYETVEHVEENTTLSKYQQSKAVKALEDAGILTTKKIGIPAKRYFLINEDAVLALVDYKKSKNCTTGSEKTAPLEVKKQAGNNNVDKKENKKENNNKGIPVAALLGETNISLPVREKVLDFLEYRKDIKKPFKSERSIRSLLKQVETQEQAHGAFAVIDVIDLSIQNGWQGIFFDKIQQGIPQQNRKAAELDEFYRMAGEFANS